MYSEEDKLLQEQIEEAAFRIALERNNNEKPKFIPKFWLFCN